MLTKGIEASVNEILRDQQVLSVAKCSGSWVVGRGRGVWVVGVSRECGSWGG